MKVLSKVTPVPEQIQLFQHRYMRGPLVVRGAAGSGKTTTALMRLQHLLRFWSRVLKSEGRAPKILVLTFNRTLRGYIAELVESQAAGVQVEIDTFAKWAQGRLGNPPMIKDDVREQKIRKLAARAGLNHGDRFIREEVSYVLGRLIPANLADYPSSSFRRDGRGIVPRFERSHRRALLEGVIKPYQIWKMSRREWDWEDLAVGLITQPVQSLYDIVVVDETQDFAANRVRAVLAHLEARSSVTFVLDAAQRIYSDFFSWKEVGLDVNPLINLCALQENHRNTKEIAAFAKPLVEGLEMGEDAGLPNLDSCKRSGLVPMVFKGRYSGQTARALAYIRSDADLSSESVAFLHPQGGGWFQYLRGQLRAAGLKWDELQAQRDWPKGPANVGLSTMQSAKGLEFDYVFILGLCDENLDCGDEPDHDSLEWARRLLAMAITRARKFVAVGFKPSEAPDVIRYLDPSTFKAVSV